MSIFLNNFSLEEKQKFLDSFDLVFCDCDGVIWQNFYDEIPGSTDAVKYLRNIGKQVVFVTNNSFISTKDQLNKFAGCGLDIEEVGSSMPICRHFCEATALDLMRHQLIHPAKTICDYLKMTKFEGPILCFSCDIFKNHLRDNGFEVVQEAEGLIKNGSLLDLHQVIFSQEPVKAVVIDVDFNLTAWKLLRAQMLLQNPACLFIAGASDPYIPFGGKMLIGPGGFIKLVEEANQRKAQVFGKPGKELGQLLLKTFAITNPQRVLMVGDSLKSDVEFGKNCGFQTLLVLTGGTKSTQLEQVLELNNKPDYMLQKLGDLNALV